MRCCGALSKMAVASGTPVSYRLRLGGESLCVGELLGRRISLHFEHRILCVACGRETRKSFANGFCFPCFRSSPENAECIIRPELCRGHLGEGRDAEWERVHHDRPHCVYLALSSHVKVGVTRCGHALTRWIDQGASAAIVLAETPYRRLAGEIEVALKRHLPERTDWRAMLRNEVAQSDLRTSKARAIELLPAHLRRFASTTDDVTWLRYPVRRWPRQPRSVRLERTDTIAGTLVGAKGQYLLFADDTVVNIRRHAGYVVTLCVQSA